jgi:hypothetical protein
MEGVFMAQPKQATKELDSVRVPIHVHVCVDTYLDFLKVRILEGAARRANARRKKKELPLLSANETLDSARDLFAEAASELERLMRSTDEAPDVARQRAS